MCVCLTVYMSDFGSFLVALIHLYRLWCCACYRLSLRCLFSLSLSLSLPLMMVKISADSRNTGTALSPSLSLSHPCDLSGRRRCAQSPALRRLQLMSLCVARANKRERSVCFRPERMLTAVETGSARFTSLAPVSSRVPVKWRAFIQHVSSGSERREGGE